VFLEHYILPTEFGFANYFPVLGLGSILHLVILTQHITLEILKFSLFPEIQAGSQGQGWQQAGNHSPNMLVDGVSYTKCSHEVPQRFCKTMFLFVTHLGIL
jgi:hypothetical protein